MRPQILLASHFGISRRVLNQPPTLHKCPIRRYHLIHLEFEHALCPRKTLNLFFFPDHLGSTGELQSAATFEVHEKQPGFRINDEIAQA